MSAILPPFTMVIYVAVTIRLSYVNNTISKADVQAQGNVLNQCHVVNASKNSEKIMEKFFPYASKYARSVMDLVTLYVRLAFNHAIIQPGVLF